MKTLANRTNATTPSNPAVASPDTHCDARTASLTKEPSMNTTTTTKTPEPTPSTNDTALPDRELAWEHSREARNAIPKEKLCLLNFDLGNAVIAMRAAHRRVLPFREQILRMPDFEPRCVDQLLTYCAAMQFGDKRVEEGQKKRPVPVEMNARAEKQWDRLVLRLRALAEDGLFPQALLDAVREGTGWKDRADDLSALGTAGLQLWPQLAGNTTLKREDFTLAIELSDELYAHFTLKNEPAELTQMQLERHQSITLAYESYEQVRRAMTWIRWAEKDAYKFAPSVHRNTTTVRNASVDEGEGEEPSEDPSEDTNREAAKPDEKSASTKKPVEAKKPAPAYEDDDGPIELGPNGLPLVPQDDPFAKD